MASREVEQGSQRQGEDERIAYTITTTNWGSSPLTDISVVAKDTSDDSDVTSTVFPVNSPSENGSDVISISLMRAITAGTTYRVEVKFTSGGSIFEAHFFVVGEV